MIKMDMANRTFNVTKNTGFWLQGNGKNGLKRHGDHNPGKSCGMSWIFLYYEKNKN